MNILIAIHESQPSRTALEEVAARPWPPGSKVEVLHVIEHAHLWELSETGEDLGRRATELVVGAARDLEQHGLATGTLVLEGDPKRVILDVAAMTKPDLIVVGTHTESAVSRFLLGNVAAAVVRHAPCSVEVIRGTSRQPGSGLRVLLATDGSSSSDFAAQSIAARPWPAGTEFRVLNVVELVLPPLLAMLEPPFLDLSRMESARGEAMQFSQDSVKRAVETLTPLGFKVTDSISVLLDGAKKIILDEAEQWGADLIVVGSHGRRGLDRFTLGSVSEVVATHAHCSVEVVRE